ncbi:MAG: hypothetical protein ACSHX5_07630 [Phycisphaerales bacterium]
MNAENFNVLLKHVLSHSIPLRLVGHNDAFAGTFGSLWSEAVFCVENQISLQGLSHTAASLGEIGLVVLKMSQSGFTGKISEELLIVAIEQVITAPLNDCWPLKYTDFGVLGYAPSLARLIDDEGLVLINGSVKVDCHGFVSDGYRIPFHRRLARNEEMVSILLDESKRNSEVDIRLAPDYLRAIPEDEFKVLLQKDHAYGRPYSRNDLDDPYATGVTIHTSPENGDKDMDTFVRCKIQQLLRVEFLWSTKKNLKDFQAEEITEHSGWRFLHAIYSLSERKFYHMDGAWMHYSTQKADLRRANNGGFKRPKADCKPKLFRIDGRFSEKLFADVATFFFRNNPLVAEYFAGQTGPSTAPSN